MNNLLHFIEKANHATTGAMLFDTLLDTVRDSGFEGATFNLLTDHKDISVGKGVAVLNNVAAGVLDEYFRQGYDTMDPIFGRAKISAQPFEWESLRADPLTPKQARCLDFRTRDMQYFNGVTVPLHGPRNQRAAISVFTRGRKTYPDCKPALLSACGHYFYLSFKRLHQRPEPASAYVVLSPSETDILAHAATGKSDTEIADALNMGRHAVNSQFRNIFRKLDTNNRVHAVTKALLLGLISP